MSWNKTAVATLFAGVVLLAAIPKNSDAQTPVRTFPSTTTGTTRKPKLEPCWQVAGVSKSAVQERRTLSQQARQEVEAVCANASLSTQQKRAEIQQIHQRERQQIDAVITPSQQEAMRSCQESRNTGHGGGHGGDGQGGPCGEMSTHHKASPQQEQDEDETSPNETPRPN
jgi:hypothetical protein